MRQNQVYKVQVSGSKTPAVCGVMSSLEEAAAASTDPGCILLVKSISESLADDLSSLKGFVANTAFGLEREANLGMSKCADLEERFGALQLLNEGRGIVFRRKEGGMDFVQCDGLVRSSSHLLLNEVKTHFMKEDVERLMQSTVERVKEVLSSPALFLSSAPGILEQLEGGLHLVPIASSSNFDAEAEQACEEAGIPRLHKDGSGFRCILPSSKPLAVLKCQ